jgi:hypothetical protein
MENKITITIEGIEEKPVLLEVDRFALVTFTEEVIKQRTYGLRISELATASSVLHAVCIREMLSQEKSK